MRVSLAWHVVCFSWLDKDLTHILVPDFSFKRKQGPDTIPVSDFSFKNKDLIPSYIDTTLNFLTESHPFTLLIFQRQLNFWIWWRKVIDLLCCLNLVTKSPQFTLLFEPGQGFNICIILILTSSQLQTLLAKMPQVSIVVISALVTLLSFLQLQTPEYWSFSSQR